MGGKRKNENDRKLNITFRLSKSVIDSLRQIKGYNRLVEELLIKYFKDNNK